MTKLKYERHAGFMRAFHRSVMQPRASRAGVTYPQSRLRRFDPVTCPRMISVSLVLVLVACTNRGPSPSAMIQVKVPAAGSQGSNTSGTGGVAGQAPVEMPVSTDPPHVGPPAPIDGSMPAADAALDAGVDSDEDAGPWVPPDPTCVDGEWRLAPGFLVARRVDYVADRDSQLLDGGGFSMTVPRTLSSAGMPCATATDRAKCDGALERPTALARHLVTTAGDNVRVWVGSASRTLLGLLDTPAEALWWVTASGPYRAPCSAKVYPSDGGYTFENLEPVPGCFTPSVMPPPTYTVILNSADGTLRELAAADGGRSLCGVP